jgi:hypothetical protein
MTLKSGALSVKATSLLIHSAPTGENGNALSDVIPGRCCASSYDVQLHIGESRDSPVRNCASEVWC